MWEMWYREKYELHPLSGLCELETINWANNNQYAGGKNKSGPPLVMYYTCQVEIADQQDFEEVEYKIQLFLFLSKMVLVRLVQNAKVGD